MTLPAAFLISVCSSQWRRTFQAAAQLSSVADGAVRMLMWPRLEGRRERLNSFLQWGDGAAGWVRRGLVRAYNKDLWCGELRTALTSP